MIALVYELCVIANYVLAIYFFRNDDVNWTFYLLSAILMSIMSLKYDNME